MSTRLVILGLLRERPLYGYEIKHIIEDHMGDWTSIAFGSIYFALGKLDKDGFIKKIATEQEGNRPSRSVYEITETGREEFKRLLQEVWQDIELQDYTFDIGLFFIQALSTGERILYAENRVKQLEGILHHLNVHQLEHDDKEHLPPIAEAIFEHSRVHMQAELNWTRELLDNLKQGHYE